MIDFADFHFLRPEWFWALLPLGVLLGLTFRLFKQQSGWQSILANHLYKHVISETGSIKKRPPMSLLAVGWILAVTALAGPTWKQLPQPVYQLNTGKVVLIDMSMSMRATDIKPNRLERAKYKAIDLINSIAEGDIGLVAYAGDAFTISPLSSDAQNLTTLLPSLTPEIMPVQGSEPFLGLQAAAELLKNAGYFEGEIFWITDGIEMTQVAELRELITQLPYRISVLGVGTVDGAPIQLLDGDFLKDSRGAIVVPKLNGNLLSGLARSTGGRYSSMTADDNDLDRLVGQSLINRDTQQQQEQNSDENEQSFGDKWQESGPYLILLLVPLAAFGFRRGYITLVCIGILLTGMQPNSAMALEWTDLWKTKNQQGAKSFKSQDFAKAASTFTDPLWKGSALYKSQEYDAALAEFAKVQSTESLYNQANTLAKLGKLDEAINAYQQVLEQQPDHQDAKANKELIEKLKQQQEQDQQQNQDQSDQEQQDSAENSQEQDGEQQGDQDQQQEQNESNQDNQDNQQSEGQDPQQDQQQSDEQQSEQQQQSQSDEQQKEQQQSQSEKDAAELQAEKQQEQQEQEQQEAESKQQSQQLAQESDAPLSDEEKEQMQRMQNLLNKVPDDPAFLLKRKMMLENQQRRREQAPNKSKRNW